MTSVRRPSSNWLGQNYDKLALAISLVLLLLSSLFLVLRIGADRNETSKVMAEAPGGGMAAVPVDLTATEQTLTLMEKPFQVTPAQQRLMAGELRVACVVCGKPIPYAATVCPYEGSAQPAVGSRPDTDGDTIPDQDELALGLNPNDASDGRADLDGDLFRNDEEFRHKTDLKDPNSFPPPVAKLRVSQILTKPFKLRFQAVSEVAGGALYQLNLRSLENTYFKKMGDMVEGYQLADFEPKAEKGPTLVLDRAGKKIRLVQGQEIQQDQREAKLVSLLDLRPFEVTAGSTFKLKDRSYKVVDIKENGVLIRDEEAGTDAQNTLIGPATPEERLLIQSGPTASSAESLPVAQ